MTFSRRDLLVAVTLLPFTGALAADDLFGDVERRSGGRLGIAALDTETGRRLDHRANERFALCSTFKFLLSAAVFARIDAGLENPNRIIPFGQRDIVITSPITSQHIGGMSVFALLQATLQASDSTAANLLLASLGGPEAWTAFARMIGDRVSRLDRNEPDLNFVGAGDLRDTTTPAAMLNNLQSILLGQVLTDASRQKLEDWMVSATTGLKRLRAGIPKDWKVADRTGTSYTVRNDIALLRPPGRGPILVSVYTDGVTLPDWKADALIAQVGQIIVRAFL
jgi:beta-lactamase class A